MRLLIALILLTNTMALRADDPAQLYATQCASCHGIEALGKAVLFSPRLAGQNNRYLREQLLAYQTGSRGTHESDIHGQTMRALTQSLTTDQISGLSTYLSAMPATTTNAPDVQGSPEGATLYRNNCATCHGQDAIGAEAIYVPNLAILSDWYLQAQLRAYELGWRGGDSGSTRAKNMRSIGAQLNNSNEQQAVAAHIASLKSQ